MYSIGSGALSDLKKLNLRFAQVRDLEAIEVLTSIATAVRTLLRGTHPDTVVSVAGRPLAIPFVGRDTADLVPWEAFDALIRWNASNRYAPVRIVDAQSPYALSAFTDPMRLAFILGHPDGKFDPKREEMTFRQALADLDTETRGRVSSPASIPTIDLAKQPRSDWAAAFAAAKPDVVLYFGHGKGAQAPALRFGPRSHDWLPLEELVRIIRDAACPMPPFWMFLACSVAEPADESPSTVSGPRAFEILRGGGALAMLAMRAKIRVDLAELLIERLAAGDPLEVAASQGRRAVRASKRTDAAHLVDWGAAAVWSSSQPVPRLKWGAIDQDSSAFSGMQLLRATADDAGLGLEAPPSWANDRVDRWRQLRRVRLLIDATTNGSVAAKTLIASVLAADRRRFGSTVLLFEVPGTDSYSMRLRDWAGGLRAQLAPSIADSVLVRALATLEAGDVQGLQLLLSIENMVLVFLDAPSDAPEDQPVWHQIFTAPDTATIVVCDRDGTTDAHLAGWHVDRIDRQYDDAMVDALLGRVPMSLALLAVLGRPVPLKALGSAVGEDVGILADSPLIIEEAASGVVLVDPARAYVVDKVGVDAVQRAHEAYVRARGAIPTFRTFDDWSEDVKHLVGAQRWSEVATFVNDLARRDGPFWKSADWIRLGAKLEGAGASADAIDPEVLLQIAATLIDRQDVGRAGLWLDRTIGRTPLQEARRLALLSERRKADTAAGSRDEMWRLLERAIAQCEAVEPGSPDAPKAAAARRDYELSLARLALYFKHDVEGAKATFERLIDGWKADLQTQTEPRARAELARSLAATLRNLGECLFEFRPFAGNSVFRAAAARHLQEATAFAEGLPGIDAEVAYSGAKLAEVSHGPAAAIPRLQACSKLALEATHYVLYRIAELRLYRLKVASDQPFEIALFRALALNLDYVGWHAWALRYAAQSRLWAAKRLADEGDVTSAVDVLERNRALLADNSGLGGDSDRATIGRTYAGIAVLANRDAVWAEFQTLCWAPKWLRGRSAQVVWSEVA